MGSSPEQSILRVRDLVVGFGDQTVLDGVSLDVYRGEILGVVGASGGGKSVLMRTIIGLTHKWRGSITVFDKDLDRAPPEEIQAVERRWGILFQQGALFSSLTAQENVQFPICEHLDLSKALIEEVAAAKLEMVGISPRRRAQIARGTLGRHGQTRCARPRARA
jgi:phospholipid/cholesterol/gamma-HCH transport system ATP-binding protein